MNRLSIFLVLATALWLPLASAQTGSQPDPAALLAQLGKRDAGRVHDPSTIVKCKDDYWLFSTGVGINSWRSKDMQTWQAGPRVFTNIPAWRTNAVPGNRGHLWAPDVIQLTNRYLLYYSVSTFGKNTSAIGLATTPTLDPDDPNFAWTDEGVVVRSYATNNFNAIDPAVTQDTDGKLWLSFGSFWSGLKLIQLDSATGKRIAPDSTVYSLAHQEAIEAPFIHRHGAHYYSFINWGVCCRGTNSTYNIRVGRGVNITGPYFDKAGVDLLHGGGTLVLDSTGPFIGPGHTGIFSEGGTSWFSCHFYDGTRRGAHTLAIRPMRWSTDGWPEFDPRPQK